MFSFLQNLLPGSWWIYIAIFVAGLGVGGTVSWEIQGYRLDKVTTEYATFKAQVAALGEKAEKEKKEIEDQYQKILREKDLETNNDIAHLRADNERLFKERAGRGYVPAVAAGSKRPDLACFDRTEFADAVRWLDEAISKLIEEGATSNIRLHVVQDWYTEVQKTNLTHTHK